MSTTSSSSRNPAGEPLQRLHDQNLGNQTAQHRPASILRPPISNAIATSISALPDEASRRSNSTTNTRPAYHASRSSTQQNIPQLSERDSIFATHYSQHDGASKTLFTQGESVGNSSLVLLNSTRPADGQTSQPPPDRRSSNKSTAAVAFLRRGLEPPARLAQTDTTMSTSQAFDTRPSGQHLRDLHSQLPPTPPSAKQHLEGSIRSYAASQALPDHLIALPPLSSPFHSPHNSPSSPQPDLDDAFPGRGPKNDARSRYRSWREGKAVLGGRVAPELEDMLEATKPVIDKKIEATLPRGEQSSNARSRKASYYLGIFKENEDAQNQKASVRQRSRNDTNRVASTSIHEEAALTTEPIDAHLEKDAIIPPGTIQHPPQTPEKQNVKPQHFVDSPLTKGETHDGNCGKANTSRAVVSIGRRVRDDVGTNILTQPVLSPEPHPLPDKVALPNAVALTRPGRQGSLTDEEEGDVEHISSAVYFPHHTLDARPHLKERKSAELLDEIDQGRQARAKETIALHPPRSRSQDNQNEDGIEFSLQSADENHYLHGDVQQTIPIIPEEVLATKRGSLATETASSASGSETEFSGDQESDDEVPGSETPRAGAIFHRARSPTPPQAIELKPFKHQVGGHTALYRFSRRAICKKLNNRENKFYETVERFHPELLDYLPR